MKNRLPLLFLLPWAYCSLVLGGDLNVSIFNDNSCDKILRFYFMTTTPYCFYPPGTWHDFQDIRVHGGDTEKYSLHAVDPCGTLCKVTFVNGDGTGPEIEIMGANSSPALFEAVLGGDPTQCTSVVDHKDPGDGGSGDGGSGDGGSGDGGSGDVGSDDAGSVDQSSDDSCGMARWWVSEPYVSLHFKDEPLGYQPVMGSRISFKLAFKQREFGTGLNPAFFSVGKRWNFSWYSLVTQTPSGTANTVHLTDGREITFQGATQDYLTNTKLSGNTNTGFTLSYSDGSMDVYGFVVTNTSGAFLEAFRTEHWNPQSQKTLFYYDNYTPGASPVVRLEYVVDGDGRTNSVYYVSSNSYSTNLIDHIVDAFGRTSFFAYDNSGHLTNITDVAQIPSSFAYNNDMISVLTTPYGSTSFQITTATNARSVLVTQPDGGTQLYLYQDSTPGLPSSYPGAQIPLSSPFSNTFDTNNLDLHNSFHWGPRQYAALSTTNIASLGTNDFLKARMKHWLSSQFFTPGDTLSMQREASPDSGGTIEGQKIWYDYFGKTNNAYEGTQVLPLFVAQVLPDGTTRFTRTMRNAIGAVTNEISTYSIGSGDTVLLRTNIYVYDPNGIDLWAATNASGILVSSNIYNGSHEVTNNYNALGEKSIYTYDASNRLTSVTRPNGLVTTNIYDGNGFLIQRIVNGFSTNSYTYTNGLVYTHTDARGVTTTNTWDSLRRLRRVDYSDGTFITNNYQFLSLVSVVDRMGFTNSFGYDSMMRLTAATNALGFYNLYSHCTCGALDYVQDQAGNLTHFYRDNLSRPTNTVYPGGYSVTNCFNLVSQITNTTDSSGASITNWFNNQGLQVVVKNAFGQVQGMAYDILDRVTNSVDANGVSINTTYDYLNRSLKRTYPDGGTELFGYTLNLAGMTSYTNQLLQVTRYGYDAANRKIAETNANLEVTQFGYSGPGDLLTLTDGKSQTTSWGYDQFGRVTNKVDAASNVIFVYGYDADNRLTNRWTPVTSNTVYLYDAGGNLKTVRYQHTTNNFAYDAMNRLTNMVDAVGTTVYGYDAAGQILSEDGPWSSDTVSYTYTNRLRTGLSLPAPNASPWTQSYGYDAARRLTNVTSAAGAFTYLLGGSSSASPLTKKLVLPNGAYITNYYDGNARLLGTYLRNSGNTNLDTYDYVYNPGNQRTQQVFTAGNYVNYAYDNIGQLKTATGVEPGGVTNRMNEQFGYVYDSAGNLNSRTNNALIQTFTVNNLNELTQVGESGTITVKGTTTSVATNVTVNTSNAILYVDNTFASTNFAVISNTNVYTAVARDSYGRVDTNVATVRLAGFDNMDYDLNGNLLRDRFSAGGTNRVFAYDDENQLVAVWLTNTWKSEFFYDGKMRRRIRKEYTWNGTWLQTNEVRYVYDGNLVIQERDANNLPQVTYTRGTDMSGSSQGAGGIGGLLARTANFTILSPQVSTFAHAFYHADGNGNVTCLTYPNQTIAAKYEYDPYGNILSQSGSLADANLYRFSSKEVHVSTGLYYFGFRFYDPNLQKWINQDPVRERGGFDLYEYVSNNPLSTRDPYGFSWWDDFLQNFWPAFYRPPTPIAGDDHTGTPNPSGGGTLVDNSTGAFRVGGGQIGNQTVLLDNGQLVNYSYWGVGLGCGGTFHSHQPGRVDGVYSADDYAGPFVSISGGIGPIGGSYSAWPFADGGASSWTFGPGSEGFSFQFQYYYNTTPETTIPPIFILVPYSPSPLPNFPLPH